MAICLATVDGTSMMRDVGDGGWTGCLLPETSFSSLFLVVNSH
jgi:hypothetical protein